MLKFYGQRVIGHNTYIAFNSNWYFKKVVSLSNKHIYYEYLENDLFIVNKKINILDLKKNIPCNKEFNNVSYKNMTILEIEIYEIHCVIEKYINDNNLNLYSPWWYNEKLSKDINERIKCLNMK